LLDMKQGLKTNAFWGVNNKDCRKWFKCISPLLFKNTYGLPVITMNTICPNQAFYVWLVDLHTICDK
jgi:hypothetical protein